MTIGAWLLTGHATEVLPELQGINLNIGRTNAHLSERKKKKKKSGKNMDRRTVENVHLMLKLRTFMFDILLRLSKQMSVT